MQGDQLTLVHEAGDHSRTAISSSAGTVPHRENASFAAVTVLFCSGRSDMVCEHARTVAVHRNVSSLIEN